MGRELLRVIKESSLSIHVRQSETTRFQSRNESLVDNVFEQFFGNLIGDILFQDKVTTQKRKVHYSPNIDPYNLFSNIYTGFAKAPYIKNSTGDIVYFGQTKQRHAIFNYAQNESNIDLYGLEINFYKQALKGKQLGMKGINISGDMFQDSSDDTIGVYKLRAIGGTFDSLNNILFSFGLSYYADSISNKNQFGIGFGGSGSLTLYPHLAAYGFFDTNFGFNIFASDVDRINWAFNKFGCGLETTFEMLKARLGYQWITGKDGTLIFQGYTSSLGIYF